LVSSMMVPPSTSIRSAGALSRMSRIHGELRNPPLPAGSEPSYPIGPRACTPCRSKRHHAHRWSGRQTCADGSPNPLHLRVFPLGISDHGASSRSFNASRSCAVPIRSLSVKHCADVSQQPNPQAWCTPLRVRDKRDSRDTSALRPLSASQIGHRKECFPDIGVAVGDAVRNVWPQGSGNGRKSDKRFAEEPAPKGGDAWFRSRPGGRTRPFV
jgi:hypothetical protein